MAEKRPESDSDTPKIHHGILSSAEIKIADFEAAMRDPEVKEFLANAKAHGEQLEQRGFIHP